MIGKRGGISSGTLIALGVLVVISIATILFMRNSDGFVWPNENPLREGTSGFEDVFGDNFKFLNYIFGRIPQLLLKVTDGGSGSTSTIETEEKLSAGIVMIAVWVIFLFIFVDVFRMFGFFSNAVNVLMGVLLIIIAANLKGLAYIAAISLSIFSVFGTFSIILSIGSVLVMFVLFHFGGKDIRQWIRRRRLGDDALRAQVGATRAAEGVAAAAAIGRAAEQAGAE